MTGPGSWHPQVFLQRLTEGLALRELWSQFRSEAQASYRLYSAEVEGELGSAPRWRRAFGFARELFWVMVLKLSPARRVVLITSLLLAALGGMRPDLNRPSLSTYGVIGLLIVLGMELADRVAMKRDLEIAREIQSWLLPQTPPRVPGLDIAFATQSANTVGGDYYDVMVRDGDADGRKLLLVVADVAGKSMPAALLMATFQATVHALVATSPPLSELAQDLNRCVCSRSQGGRRFTTALLAELDAHNEVLTYINAGHNYPVLWRARGCLERLTSGGMPFGIRAGAAYEIGTVPFTAGDLLVVFTDGVVDAINERGDEYGDPRLIQLVEHSPEESAEATLKRVMAEVARFTGSTRQHDDMTMLVVRAERPEESRPE